MQGDQTRYSKIMIRPIGVVHSELKSPVIPAGSEQEPGEDKMDEIRARVEKTREVVSELEIDPQWQDALQGLEDFSHVMVLYWAHLVPENRRGTKKVRPMGRKDMPLRGVLATCSPARPNPILVSTVPLIDRRGNIIRVKGLEALDGSPILDIKPFVSAYHGARDSTVPAWLQQIQQELEGDPGARE